MKGASGIDVVGRVDGYASTNIPEANSTHGFGPDKISVAVEFADKDILITGAGLIEDFRSGVKVSRAVEVTCGVDVDGSININAICCVIVASAHGFGPEKSTSSAPVTGTKTRKHR